MTGCLAVARCAATRQNSSASACSGWARTQAEYADARGNKEQTSVDRHPQLHAHQGAASIWQAPREDTGKTLPSPPTARNPIALPTPWELHRPGIG